MTQFRAMDDNAAEADEVLAIAIPWLRACPDLVVGSTTQLSHRGNGRRVVFEVLLAPDRGPQRAHAERVDQPATAPAQRRALPRGRRTR
ncbi:hypothetical protein AB0F17_34940 [Nonomuraea sp. NPDC026600]|uniref:hypothetical protein n=1 Tax=Nonomuraea sp. NPDC026600 TaxID=3155363 RepID=UPI0034089073